MPGLGKLHLREFVETHVILAPGACGRGSEGHFKTPLQAQQAQQARQAQQAQQAQQAHRDHQEVNSQKLVLEQHSITLGLLTPPGNHAEVCFRATLHYF